MEKILSVEERIKKAEEIYNRRGARSGQIGFTHNISKTRNPKYNELKAIKKMLFQIIVCLFIYSIFYAISNSGYVFSEDFKNNVNSLLNTQTDFNKIYNDSISFLSGLLSTNNESNVDNFAEKQDKNLNDDQKETEKQDQNLNDNQKENEDKDNNLDTEKNENNKEQNNGEENQSNEDIGGAIEENIVQNEKSQMEIDAEDIKNSISFEIPVEGRISSTFGPRNPTTSTVPKNHTGLDIAANTGTVIKSATDGTVILASSNGDYGKHYKIEIGDVVIIYAHCSKLYLEEGATVKKGQSIAEVGSTGNSTGPHLHFEIRKDGRPVDPQLILDI